MADKLPVALGPAQETLLIPLYGRASLTRARSPLINDPGAVEMVDALDYDFTRFDGLPSLLGTVLRTRIHDHWLARWLADNPTGTVVEIGVGLNTRHDRIDTARVRWFDLDLPDAMDLRRRLVPDTDRRTSIAGSVLDDGWVDTVAATGGPWYLIAEAVLGFLPEPGVRQTLTRIGRRLPGAHLAFDTAGRWMVEHQDDRDALSLMDARIRWSCDNPTDLEHRDTGLRIVESRILPDAPPAVLDLLPEPMAEMLQALRQDPQIASYRQNLARYPDTSSHTDRLASPESV
jgi:O-methyltransferase involved in polyketide biosynthesis